MKRYMTKGKQWGKTAAWLAMALSFSVLTAWINSKPMRVVFFGDSITQMGVNEGGYIWRMQRNLQQNGKGGEFELIGSGIGGNKVYDLYLRLEEDVLAKEPDVVFVFIGVNDVWHKSSHGTGTDLDKFEKFYKAIIQKLTARQIRPVLVTPAGIGELKGNANPQDADLNQYSDVVRKLAAQHRLTLVDLRLEWQAYQELHNTGNAEKGVLTTDRVHLNDAGNEWVAQAMLKALGQ
ncbi:MAG TPA: SGNH/GDSL hydrolase family protein [Phnomibacter sp.]|nr:SGNH/GDSL hydrolase family protein [Phnomibacter sp.]